MKFVKRETMGLLEPRYDVQEIAQAIGLSEGTISSFFTNKGQSTRDGLTLDEIVKVLERPRRRGDGIDWNVVKEIRRRLVREKGYTIDRSDECEEAENAE